MFGCFQALMNVIDTIRELMQNTGFRNIMEVVYGENTVQHMMTIKSLAFRRHLLIDRCLIDLIVSDRQESSTHFLSLTNEKEKLYLSLILKQITVKVL